MSVTFVNLLPDWLSESFFKRTNLVQKSRMQIWGWMDQLFLRLKMKEIVNNIEKEGERGWALDVKSSDFLCILIMVMLMNWFWWIEDDDDDADGLQELLLPLLQLLLLSKASVQHWTPTANHLDIFIIFYQIFLELFSFRSSTAQNRHCKYQLILLQMDVGPGLKHCYFLPKMAKHLNREKLRPRGHSF